MPDRLSVELKARVYDDDHGFYTEVGPDQDGLGICQLLYSDGDKDAVPVSFTVSWDMAGKLAETIFKLKTLNQEAPAEGAGDSDDANWAHRQWLASKLLDRNLPNGVAYSIVHASPEITPHPAPATADKLRAILKQCPTIRLHSALDKLAALNEQPQ